VIGPPGYPDHLWGKQWAGRGSHPPGHVWLGNSEGWANDWRVGIWGWPGRACV